MTDWEKFEEKPTDELIIAFQQSGGAKKTKEIAFFAIVHRFKRDLLDKCEINCARFGHSANTAEIIAENTFEAYAKKGKFDSGKSKGRTVDDSFRIYLYGIARNELTNFFRLEEKKTKGQFYDGTEKIITELPAIDLETLDTKDKIKYEIIQSLPASHKTVYLTYMAYERVGCNLPKQLQHELRRQLGDIGQNTIRSYKKEAIDKINEGLKIMNLTLNSE